MNHAIMDEHVHDPKQRDAKPSAKADSSHKGGRHKPEQRYDI